MPKLYVPRGSSVIVRLNFFRIIRGPDECWGWKGATHSAGYAVFRMGGQVIYGHRAAFEEEYGPLRPGMESCHRCDNPPCTNPRHLFEGTHAENFADAAAKGRMPRGETHPSARLRETTVRQILADARTHRLIAAEFGISRRTVGNIKAGRAWRHVL